MQMTSRMDTTRRFDLTVKIQGPQSTAADQNRGAQCIILCRLQSNGGGDSAALTVQML